MTIPITKSNIQNPQDCFNPPFALLTDLNDNLNTIFEAEDGLLIGEQENDIFSSELEGNLDLYEEGFNLSEKSSSTFDFFNNFEDRLHTLFVSLNEILNPNSSYYFTPTVLSTPLVYPRATSYISQKFNHVRSKLSSAVQSKQRSFVNKSKKFLTNITSSIGRASDYISTIIEDFITPVKGRLTSGFGPRNRPTTGASTNHKGIDIAAKQGTTVIASASGRVAFAGQSRGYGNLIIIDHGKGTTTRYGHLSAITVQKDQRVAQGEKIGAVGSTGVSTGPHLHFEIRENGIAQNPHKHIDTA